MTDSDAHLPDPHRYLHTRITQSNQERHRP